MKLVKYLVVAVVAVFTTSCNFTETMTLNEDGSGKMSVFFDASELMAFGGDQLMGKEGEGEGEVMDSIIDFKEFIRENKDSIMTLPAEEQRKIMALENFKMHVIMNEEEGKLSFDMFTDFENVKEASNILEGFDQMSTLMAPDTEVPEDEVEVDVEESDEESVKVRYDFTGNVFKRDAYILDAVKYQSQVDSLESMAMFFGGSSYKLQYTFPKKIKSTNRESATFSSDGMTLYYEVNFMEYMKDPDLMDIEVILED